jgi:hypothetical protein
MGEAKRRREAGEKPRQSANIPADFKRLADIANAHPANMDDTVVMELIDAYDVVWGIWQDNANPGGVGARIVKGENRLRDTIATGGRQNLRVTAINCFSAEQAAALRQHVGADHTH